MKKINVIGTTGSGKSTFSKLLAKKLGYPCIHMDQLFWKPNWVESSDEEFIPKVESAVSGESWVLDGNYSRTNDIKWQHADTIIWLDYSYARTFLQLLRRTVTRAITKEELWPGTGNRESFSKSFASKDSIFIWFFRCYKRNKIRYEALTRSPAHSHIHFIRLQSPNDAKAFIERIGV
ncbi:adenylate kinase [Alkalilimnicola ehrlichii]|uniref:Adenylate kinase n=1 Tax=Alkalilimnicola ehrlichii TaxID=351052 RepID=A0A3E0WWW8_9GAMM|nr:AAA family ATPase [Alkalilimnicola ehrlichii]RFA29918.1 adenylate kinase [Alkalilimnicola ehrlichii]RFA36506.1 adenylate kinase [Alkalilimnicola ehrlichii]